jgi:hypothetical protein
VTLGFGEIIRILLNNWTNVTGGPNGIGGIPDPTLFGMEFGRRVKEEGNTSFHETFGIAYSGEHKVIFLYLIALVLAIITALIIRRLMKMPVGRAWEALREDEIAARSLGLSRTAVKLSAFTIGAFFAGFAGTTKDFQLHLRPGGHDLQPERLANGEHGLALRFKLIAADIEDTPRRAFGLGNQGLENFPLLWLAGLPPAAAIRG